MTLFPKNLTGPVQIVVDVHVQATAHRALFPDEFWDAAMILDPVKRASYGSDRPKRWGMLVSELVYAPLGIEVDLKLMAKNGCEKWHQHLDEFGRDLVLRQCLLVSRAVRMGTTLSKLRRAFATRSVPKSTISFSFGTSTPSRTVYVSRIVP